MYNINGWVNKKFIVWIPEALLGNSLNFLAPSTSGKSSPSFCPSNAYPFFLSIVLSSCLKLHVNHNGNSCFLHCKPKFKEKVWCVCEWMMYICMWYMLTSHVWEHDFLCGWMPKENTGALVCHCHPYSSEQVFHWRWNWGGRFLLSALHSAGVIIMHVPCPDFFMWMLGSKSWTLCLWSNVKHSDTLSQLTSSKKNYLSIYYEPQSSLWTYKIQYVKGTEFCHMLFWNLWH